MLTNTAFYFCTHPSLNEILLQVLGPAQLQRRTALLLLEGFKVAVREANKELLVLALRILGTTSGSGSICKSAVRTGTEHIIVKSGA